MSIGAGTQPPPLLDVERDITEAAPALVEAGRLGAGSRHWRQIRGNLALGYLSLLVLIAIIGPAIAPFGANGVDVNNILKGPSGHHWLGTDQIGRDTLSRLLLGARSSLLGIVLAVGVAIILGGTWGLLAGYGPRFVDEILMRLADSILSFPALVLAVAVVGALGSEPRARDGRRRHHLRPRTRPTGARGSDEGARDRLREVRRAGTE